MAVDQVVTNKYAVYNGDCIEAMKGLPAEKVHLSIYSPPFAGLYHYSSDERDLSNCKDYDEFFAHYAFVVKELHRLTLPGRISVVHCMDVPKSNSGKQDSYIDFPGDIIRLHEKLGWSMASPRICIWKEPLTVRNRTMTKSLAHKTIVDDSSNCTVAGADYLLIFRKRGTNRIPIQHPHGMITYAGSREMPPELRQYRGWKGKQTENRYSHWIWRQYASCFWDDIRLDRVLPYREARDEEDEKHIHPLQLDVIERACVLWSNPGEVVFTPFLGVGSEACGAVMNGRKAIGAELKPSYFRQAVKNLDHVIEYGWGDVDNQEQLFSEDWLEAEEP